MTNDDYELMLADISAVFRKYAKLHSKMSAKEAVDEIRYIVNPIDEDEGKINDD